MNKIQVTLDAAKLRKLVSQRSYENKQGETVILQEVKFELCPIKPENHKTIFEKDRFKIVKTHFASVIQTKEERESKADTIYIGEGFSHIWANDEPVQAQQQTQSATPPPSDDLPF